VQLGCLRRLSFDDGGGLFHHQSDPVRLIPKVDASVHGVKRFGVDSRGALGGERHCLVAAEGAAGLPDKETIDLHLPSPSDRAGFGTAGRG